MGVPPRRARPASSSLGGARRVPAWALGRTEIVPSLGSRLAGGVPEAPLPPDDPASAIKLKDSGMIVAALGRTPRGPSAPRAGPPSGEAVHRRHRPILPVKDRTGQPGTPSTLRFS